MSDTEQKLTTIYTAANPVQGRLLQNLLEEEGIDSYVLNDALQIAAGELSLGWSTAVRVAVSATDAERARAIAKSAEGRLHEGIIDSKPADGGVDIQPVWPLCPNCHQPRTAVCPICGSHGTNLAAAEIEPREDAGEEAIDRWICATCDEPMAGSFLRRCESCHHDFGAGVELPVEEEPVWETVKISPRLLVAGIVLVVFVSLIFLYFTLLLG